MHRNKACIRAKPTTPKRKHWFIKNSKRFHISDIIRTSVWLSSPDSEMPLDKHLNIAVVLRQKAAESEVISSVVLALSAAGEHPDAVRDGIALPCVGVLPLREQGRDAHHLSCRLRFLELVLPC